MEIIKVKNLRKEFISYKRKEGLLEAFKALFYKKEVRTRAIKDISFSINKGEIVGFLGPNGAGKSTTIKILTGIMYPEYGEVDILGFCPWTQRIKYVANIGAVFGQKSQLYWDLPPIDAFYFHQSIFQIPKEEFEKELKYLSEMLKVTEIMKRPTRQLSLGERMRCEFLIAMLHKPKIVFLDEPTIGLDIFAKEIIRKFIKKINKEKQTTFIVTSHDLEDIEHLCNRVIIINHGDIVFNDDTSKLKPDNTKYIKAKFYNKIDLTKIKNIKNIKIVEHTDFSIIIKANTSKITLTDIISKLLKISKIEDLEVSNPKISELIKKLFKSKK